MSGVGGEIIGIDESRMVMKRGTRGSICCGGGGEGGRGRRGGRREFCG